MRRQLLDPLLHDVDVAKIAEALKQAPAGLFHGLPVGIGIERHQAICQRAAAAQGDAEVVNGIRAEPGRNVLALLQHAGHPVAQTGSLVEARYLTG